MLKAIENAERERKCLKAIGRLAVDGAALVAGHPLPTHATCQFRRATTTLCRPAQPKPSSL